MGVRILSSDQGAKMQNSQDIQCDLSARLLDAIGGEPLTGSGFEAEEPESGFFSDNQVEE
jgi:hypothetical protein